MLQDETTEKEPMYLFVGQAKLKRFTNVPESKALVEHPVREWGQLAIDEKVKRQEVEM